MRSKESGQIQVYPSSVWPNKHVIYLEQHIIGVLRWASSGYVIDLVKVAIADDGMPIYAEPPMDMRKTFDSISDASDQVLSLWLSRGVQAPAQVMEIEPSEKKPARRKKAA